MANNANIMLPSNKLFPLGVVVVILGGKLPVMFEVIELMPGLIIAILSILLYANAQNEDVSDDLVIESSPSLPTSAMPHTHSTRKHTMTISNQDTQPCPRAWASDHPRD
jgi:hypothetical protein